MTKEEANQKDWDMDFVLVLRPEAKSMVTSKLIYKIKHVVDGSIDVQSLICDKRILPTRGRRL